MSDFWGWMAGITTGAVWMFLNIFFLARLLEMSLGIRPQEKNKVLLLAIIKFPVLYLSGFYLLSSKLFPLYSLLAGLTLTLITFGITRFRLHRQNAVEKSVS